MMRPKILALALLASSLAPLPASAQRSVGGSTDDEEDEDDEDAGTKKKEDPPADPKADPKDPKAKKKDDKKKADEKKADEKKPDEKKADEKADPKADPKKTDEKAKPDAKSTKKATPDDVLEDTAEDKKKRKAEDDAKAKADAAASASDAKKAEEKAKLAEERKAADDKRRLDTREQRLTSAKKVRPLMRDEGALNVQVALEPGAVVKGDVVEVRFDIGKKLDVPDPKFGNREPLKNLKLKAIVSDASGKKDSAREYAVHSTGSPGNYGFHMTPTKDGVVSVQLTGTYPDGEGGERSVNVTFPVHVGVWPPPDFDDEDKKLLAKGS